MSEPENHTLRLLRELRDNIQGMEKRLDSKFDAVSATVGRNHEELKKRLDSLQKALIGESILGRYATAEFEERLNAIERRVFDLEQQR